MFCCLVEPTTPARISPPPPPHRRTHLPLRSRRLGTDDFRAGDGNAAGGGGVRSRGGGDSSGDGDFPALRGPVQADMGGGQGVRLAVHAALHVVASGPPEPPHRRRGTVRAASHFLFFCFCDRCALDGEQKFRLGCLERDWGATIVCLPVVFVYGTAVCMCVCVLF